MYDDNAPTRVAGNDMPPPAGQKSNTQRNILIGVGALLVILCCCLVAVAGVLYFDPFGWDLWGRLVVWLCLMM